MPRRVHHNQDSIEEMFEDRKLNAVNKRVEVADDTLDMEVGDVDKTFGKTGCPILQGDRAIGFDQSSKEVESDTIIYSWCVFCGFFA